MNQQKLPNLDLVIHWLSNGCDVGRAVDELKIYQKLIDQYEQYTKELINDKRIMARAAVAHGLQFIRTVDGIQAFSTGLSNISDHDIIQAFTHVMRNESDVHMFNDFPDEHKAKIVRFARHILSMRDNQKVING